MMDRLELGLRLISGFLEFQNIDRLKSGVGINVI